MATTNKVKKVIYSSLFGLGLTAGGVTLASAATTQEKPPTTVEAPDASAKQDGADTESTESNAAEHDDADEKPNYTSSVTVPVTKDGAEGSEADEGSKADEDRADKDEQAKLEKVAKIDAKSASKAATDTVPGTVGDVELDEEHGNVVYEVEVTAKNGTETDVIVDAGDGKILAQETDEKSDDKDHESDDKAEQAKLEKAAKIDAKAASKAATDKVPGTVGDVELDEVDTKVVYEVEVTAKDGTETDVIVDATNGKVLSQQAD